MTAQLELLNRVLEGASADHSGLRGPHKRLADAWLSDLPGRAISGDVGALISQVLRHEREVSGVAVPLLRLCLDDRGISPAELGRSNLVCARYGVEEHQVTLGEAWKPEWLHGDLRWIDVACASPGPLRTATGREVPTYARPDTPVPIDPAVHALSPSLTRYRSRTQASALRTATLAHPSAALHVVLPTGTGKSLVGLAPGILRPGGNTVVVVPTVALALDQERAALAQFPDAGLPPELAYYGDRADGGKAAILQRLKAGTQRVVFASPEAMVTGLASPLHALAGSGTLTSIVVDEAHLVRSWGLDFRPEYQLMGALVEEMRATAAASGHREPHVILMTATLSKESLDLNDALFRGSSRSFFVGSAFLRTELRYLQGGSPSSDARLERLVEAMHYLPRPAIVYTTRRADAEQVAHRLRESGFARTDVFHGDIRGSERLEILRRWSGSHGPSETDIVVGTSAFGLGVDQPDVRSVVHACVPASVDRYYQEVGRAGRDGHNSVAVWLTAPEDIPQARAIEGATLIGDEKAWDRWAAMLRHCRSTDSGHDTFAVDVTTLPPSVTAPSEANRLWNRNTLTLMERAGLITVRPERPPRLAPSEGESEADFALRYSAAWNHFNSHVRVQVKGNVNLDRSTFETRLADLRRSIRASESASRSRIEGLLALETCWAELFAEEYELHSDDAVDASLSIVPACSGCPAKEHRPRPSDAPATPVVADAPMPQLGRRVDDTLHALAAGGTVIIAGYSGSLRLKLQNLVQRCVSRGVRGLLVSPSLANSPGTTTAPLMAADEGLIAVDLVDPRIPQVNFPVPTLVLLDHGEPARISWVAPSGGSLRIVVVPEDLGDPEKPDQRIMDYRAPTWTLDEFMRRI